MKDQFQFKQFTIRHDRCAMKVGTDGVLLGAWGTVAPPRILDIGTGTGLIALMAAQRCPDAQVLGIDIDRDAVEQARENVAASPFADRVSIRQQSLQELVEETDERAKLPTTEPPTFRPALCDASSLKNSQLSTLNSPLGALRRFILEELSTFSAILCNPPFFEETLLPPDARRSQARHTPTLPFSVLINAVSKLLIPEGSFSIILPTTAFDDFRRCCFSTQLVCTRLCHVQTTPTKAPKRVLATFNFQPHSTSLTTFGATLTTSEQSSLISHSDGPATLILNHGTARSPEYAALTRDFYLW